MQDKSIPRTCKDIIHCQYCQVCSVINILVTKLYWGNSSSPCPQGWVTLVCCTASIKPPSPMA
uniref:Uncharacterized protein n=1 Tax=Anguilla anguilla TaxID=7936 RepID=A0A0E9WVB3_ANGAN